MLLKFVLVSKDCLRSFKNCILPALLELCGRDCLLASRKAGFRYECLSGL